jgi:hypothetical protein
VVPAKRVIQLVDQCAVQVPEEGIAVGGVLTAGHAIDPAPDQVERLPDVGDIDPKAFGQSRQVPLHLDQRVVITGVFRARRRSGHRSARALARRIREIGKAL